MKATETKSTHSQHHGAANTSFFNQEQESSFFSESNAEQTAFFQPEVISYVQPKLIAGVRSFFQPSRVPSIQAKGQMLGQSLQTQISVGFPKVEDTRSSERTVAVGNSRQGFPKISPLLRQGTPLVQASFGQVPATPGWSQRVQQAGRAYTQMALLNEVFTRIYPDIQRRFRDLRLPLRPHQRGQEIDGGVYYNSTQTDSGMTDQRTVTTGGSCSGCACTPTETHTNVFIVLGPNALSEGTPKFSENILYHEYVHFLQRKGRMHRTLLARSRPVDLSTHREALAHAESFRHYFGQLYWQGSSRMPGGQRPAEAIYSLELINRRYYEQSDDPVRAEVLRLLTSVVQEPNRTQKATFLRDLANHLSLNGWTHRSVLREHLLPVIP